MCDNSGMKIWVDADACPALIKDILFRAAIRLKLDLTLVANQSLQVPRSPYIKMIRVAAGFDVADNEIVKRIEAGDVLISSDIPLAAEAIEKGAAVLSPRGEEFSPETIRERLMMRDFMDTLRGSGLHSGGPPPLSQADRKAFADALDRQLNKRA